MSTRLRTTFIGLACLACCLPLVLGVAGTTTGIAGAVGAWLGNYEIAVISLIGLAVVATLAASELRPSHDVDGEEEDVPT